MPEQVDEVQKSLAPPGAGLPRGQALLLRFLAFPLYCATTRWEKALEAFTREGERILALVEPLSPSQFQQRVLVQAPIGMEDSSRYWSSAMVLEHLIEVGSRVATGIVELTNGEPVSIKADVADVKPQGGKGPEIIAQYRDFLQDYVHTLREDVGDVKSQLRHLHPWFGNLTAHQWACLGAIHQGVHRRQVQRIVAGLEVVDVAHRTA